MSTTTPTKNPLPNSPPTKPVSSTNSVALPPDTDKDCALSSVLAKAAYFGPTPFLHFFLKYMELTGDNKTKYKFTNNETWKTMYKLMLNLMKNKRGMESGGYTPGGMGGTNDTNLIKLLQKNNKIKAYYNYHSSDTKHYIVSYDNTTYICIGKNELITQYTTSDLWEKKFNALAENIFGIYKPMVDKNKKIVIVGSFISGCVAEILGLKLSKKYNGTNKNITVLTWNSPSWINQTNNWTTELAKNLANKNFTLRKFRTHGSIYSEMPRKYLNLTGKDKNCIRRDPYTKRRVIVQPGYKQLGDDGNTFKNGATFKPVKNNYTYYVKSHGYDETHIKDNYIIPVEGDNELKYNGAKYNDPITGCNQLSIMADRRWGKINAVTLKGMGSNTTPWSSLWGQKRIDQKVVDALEALKTNNTDFKHNLKAQKGGRRKTRKRRKRKGGKKSRKNKRKTRRKSKKRRRRTRRRKRR